MGILDIFKSKKKDIKENIPISEPRIESSFSIGSQGVIGSYYPIITKTFDGEKTPGEMGNVINFLPDHTGLRFRAYEQELKSDIVKIITGKFFKWVIGPGLELQCQPNEVVLKSEGYPEINKDFRTITENRYRIYSNSKYCDYSRMQNLHDLAQDAFKTSFLGGDCLVVLRLESLMVNVQVIDGQEIVSPSPFSDYHKEAKERGNRIVNGIELSKRNEHVAFYVVTQKEDFTTEVIRIDAKEKSTGRTMAWMVYSSKHRINHVRGIPQISSILEKVEKLDRYTEATVSGAEERAKIVYAIEHTKDSTGENLVVANIKQNLGVSVGANDPHQLGDAISKNISATTSKSTFNMPIGSKLTSLDSDQEINYEVFFRAVFFQLCSAVDIPPEVALQKYDSNYSASRAAINGWGYIIDIYRKKFSDSFYKGFYSFWLETEILKNKISVPGYLKALNSNNVMAVESYGFCRFTGINLPHIDPLKEVNAVRRMLGDVKKGEAPLITHERATEILNQGEWTENFKKFSEEYEEISNSEYSKDNKEQQTIIDQNNKQNESSNKE